MQSKPNSSSRKAWNPLFPRLELRNASTGRNQSHFDRLFQPTAMIGNPQRKPYGEDAVTSHQQNRRDRIAHHQSSNQQQVASWQESNSEDTFYQPEMSQLTMSQVSCFENQDAASLRSNHSSSKVSNKSTTFPPLHQNSSVSSASAASRQDGGSRASAGIYRDNGSNHSSAPYPGSGLSRFQRAHNPIPPSTPATTGDFLSTRAEFSAVHSRSHLTPMASSQMLLRMTPRRISYPNSARSVLPSRNSAPSVSLFSHASASKKPVASSHPPLGQDSTNVGSAQERSFSRPGTSSVQEMASCRDEQMKSLRVELESLFSERMRAFGGQLQAKVDKVVETGSSEIKKQVETRETELDARIQELDDKLGAGKDDLDERLRLLGDEFEAKQAALGQGMRLLDDKLAATQRAASSYVQKIESAAESHLEAMSKSAKSYMKKIGELAEASTESLTRKCDDIVTAILPVLQPPVTKMVGSLFKRPGHNQPKSDESRRQAGQRKLVSPPPNKRSSSTRSQRQKDKAAPVAHMEKASLSKKRPHSVITDEMPSDWDETKHNEPTEPATRRRSARRAKRVKDEEAGKENNTPSSKIQRPCATPSRKKLLQVVSPLDNHIGTPLKAKKTSEKKRIEKSPMLRRSRRRIVESSQSSLESSSVRIPPFEEVIAENNECPSPLSDRSVQFKQVEICRTKKTAKRTIVSTSLAKGVKSKRSRIYGKRSWNNNPLQDDPFTFV
jgi:hypothetical protein